MNLNKQTKAVNFTRAQDAWEPDGPPETIILFVPGERYILIWSGSLLPNENTLVFFFHFCGSLSPKEKISNAVPYM